MAAEHEALIDAIDRASDPEQARMLAERHVLAETERLLDLRLRIAPASVTAPGQPPARCGAPVMNGAPVTIAGAGPDSGAGWTRGAPACWPASRGGSSRCWRAVARLGAAAESIAAAAGPAGRPLRRADFAALRPRWPGCCGEHAGLAAGAGRRAGARDDG